MTRRPHIEVTFLSTLQQVAGRETFWLELPEPPTVERVLALLRERLPQFAGVDVVSNLDGVSARGDQRLAAGDSLFLLPPE